jgi:hypothetical protein
MFMRGIRSRRVRNFVSWPVHIISRLFSSFLSDRLLLALEVAIEYWLALTYSMEAKHVAEDASLGSQEAHVQQALRAEMEAQKSCVWQFITDRCSLYCSFARCCLPPAHRGSAGGCTWRPLSVSAAADHSWPPCSWPERGALLSPCIALFSPHLLPAGKLASHEVGKPGPSLMQAP